ncbi:uncharacterized protein F4822DRAFT_253398 [Hypoxylon trugodes]|uniref:uncharacterized protein n=1 Tax=Hypoxylon trugodes TaxID=326681 RepID=UPI0021A1274A|nr:uncharacterized protein F4822DRAFT_253398 [Hypoxylon trugodes]KAI1388690.1 hypothetical protein F4822DRAFT_253398 [Hypoxylon trugodes]
MPPTLSTPVVVATAIIIIVFTSLVKLILAFLFEVANNIVFASFNNFFGGIPPFLSHLFAIVDLVTLCAIEISDLLAVVTWSTLPWVLAYFVIRDIVRYWDILKGLWTSGKVSESEK